MNQFLTPKQVAELLQLSERTLANQRCCGRGIPYIKLGRSIRYRISDIQELLSKQSVMLSYELEVIEQNKGNLDGI